MESLLYFLIWAGMIFLMMRMGCGKHVMGHGNSGARPGKAADGEENQALYWEPPSKDADPVCGETVSTATAKPSVLEGKVYYFCSNNCREAFEAAPDIYLAETPKKLEARNV